MTDLYLVRLHSEACPHRKKGQQYLSCKCSLGVDGYTNGKRVRKSLETRNLDKAYRKLAALERPDYREPKSIRDAIDAFQLSKEDSGHGTKRNRRRALSNFLRITKAVGITKLDDVEIETIDLFRSGRAISASTWVEELAILRNFFAFCVSRRWISLNPAKEIKPPPIKPKAKEPFRQEELIRILSACEQLGRGPYERSRARAMVLLLRYTGLRISDVATLPRDRIRDGNIHLHTMKNGKRIFLPIPPVLCTLLEALPQPKGTVGPSRYLF